MRRSSAVVIAAYVVAVTAFFAVMPAGTVVWPLVIMTALSAVAIAALARARLSPRATAVVILGVGALLQLVMLTRAPLTSDDANRYVWDAKVQFSGVDPYRYVPQAPELAHLRQADLFGSTSACTHPIPGSCTAINRPDVRTVYPPVAQLAFDAGRVLSFGGHGGTLVYQVLGALGALAVGALLARCALRRGLPVWPVALWSWSPIVLSEFGNNGHLDWLAVLLTLLALRAAEQDRPRSTGFLIAAAILTKLYPALVLPALIRRRPWVVLVTTAATVVLSYVPHVAAVGAQVIGYLPGYLHEEGYDSGSRMMLLGTVLPHPIDTLAGVLVVAAAAWWAWRHVADSSPERAAVTLVGVAFLVTTPSYGWYAGLLLALAIRARRYEWLPVAFAPSVVYLVHGHWLEVGTYAVSLVLMLALRQRTIQQRILRFFETSEPAEAVSAKA